MAHKRNDFATFCGHISEAQFQDLVEELKTYLRAVFDGVDNEEKVFDGFELYLLISSLANK